VSFWQGGVGHLYRSTDGVNWSYVPDDKQPIWDIAFGNGEFVAVGVGRGVTSSSDGLTWSDTNSGRFPSAVEFGGGAFVAIDGYPNDRQIIRSIDAISWSPVLAVYANLGVYDVHYINGLFVILRLPLTER
jgi:hypothetical protein